MTLCGGFSDEQQATEEIQSLIDSLQPEIESGRGAYKKFVALSFRQQVVAGMNYVIDFRAERENGEVVKLQIKVFQPLPHTGQGPQLSGLSLLQ